MAPESEKPAAPAPAAAAAEPPATPAPAAAPAPPAPAAADATARRAADAPLPKRKKPVRRKTTENAIGAFILAILVGGIIAFTENGRCPGAIRAAFLAATPVAVMVATLIAALMATSDKTATREEKISRGIVLGVWSAAAAVAMATGMLLVINEQGSKDIRTTECEIERRETVPARTAGVGEWLLVLRCSETMSPVRVDVDRRTWWANEAGGTVTSTVATGRLGFEWVVDTELGPPMRGFTNW